jgi:hypothetical protein
MAKRVKRSFLIKEDAVFMRERLAATDLFRDHREPMRCS